MAAKLSALAIVLAAAPAAAFVNVRFAAGLGQHAAGSLTQQSCKHMHASRSTCMSSAAASVRGGGTAGTAPAGVKVVSTAPIAGMRPGTSGLRKKVTVWQGEHYLENFVQCILEAQGDALRGATLVVGGDGRYHNSAAIQTIIRMAAANGVARVWVGRGGLLSTPAVSAIIRERRGPEGEAALLGIVLTASHNPGGPSGDFGIKFNNAAGSPAPESVTEAVYELTQTIDSYKTLEGTPDVDLSTVGSTQVGSLVAEVIDSAEDYVQLLRRTFDFAAISALLKRPDFSMVYDAMAGAAGPYARR
eukprot:11310-Heterococcus_DN1.PRE.1